MSDTPKANNAADSGLHLTTCSLSSGSDVDAAFPISTNWHFPDTPEYLQQRAVAVKLENERNKMTAFASDLLKEKRKLIALCEWAKSICLRQIRNDGDESDWITDYEAFLSENVLAHAPGADENP